MSLAFSRPFSYAKLEGEKRAESVFFFFFRSARYTLTLYLHVHYIVYW